MSVAALATALVVSLPMTAASTARAATHAPLAVAAVARAAAPAPIREQRFSQGRFGPLVVYRPPGRPTSVALFVSGDGGWNLGVVDMARALASRGAVVVGIDVRHYRAEVNSNGSQCQYIAGEWEYLSHFVQKQLGLDEYHVPVLVGYSSGATLAYAVLVQSPKGTYSGALSLGFCPDLDFTRPLCGGAGLEYELLRTPVAPTPGVAADPTAGKVTGTLFRPARTNASPWIVLHGDVDDVCPAAPVGGFVAGTGRAELVRLPHVGHGFSVEKNWQPQFLEAYARLANAAAGARDAGLVVTSANASLPSSAAGRTAGRVSTAATPMSAPPSDLPLVEVATAHAPEPSLADTFAVLLTGDGGWAGIDQDVSGAFAARGVPVVALNSLKYFWKERAPDVAARDLDRVVAHYARAWGRSRVLLVGYSFGADVLPFLYNRLPAPTRARVRSVSLLGFSDAADFEFHVADWLPGAGGRQPTLPEARRIDVPLLCVHGDGEEGSACPQLQGPRVTNAVVGEGHHFGNDADGLVRRILAAAPGGA